MLIRILIRKEQTELKNIIKKLKWKFWSYVKLLCRIESCESIIIIKRWLFLYAEVLSEKPTIHTMYSNVFILLREQFSFSGLHYTVSDKSLASERD